METFTVYEHINKENSKRYIGITSKDINTRSGKNGLGYKGSTYFYNAINKYGWDNFEHNILKVELSDEEAKNLEIKLIAKYKTTNSEYGYNLMHGGQGNIPNNIVRQKMSNSQKKVWDDLDHRDKMVKIRKEIGATKEFKEQISNATKKAWKNEGSRSQRILSLKRNGETKEFKEKMSIITTGSRNGFYGLQHTKETKQIMRDKKLGIKLTQAHKDKVAESLKRKVVKLDIKGNYITTYNGISRIEDIKTTSHISACCRGKRKTAGGYKWMYAEDYQALTK